MRRRAFLLATAGTLFTAGGAGHAQKGDKVRRIGFLHPGMLDPGYTSLRQGLGALGFVVGKNLVIEERFASGNLDRLPALAAELVRENVEVIVAVSPSAIRAAKDATATIPIVMDFSGDDPVKSGFMKSLAHPGGNITGMTALSRDLAPKWIELLHEAAPKPERIAVLGHLARPDHADQIEAMAAAARPRGIRLGVVSVQGADDYERAFATMSRDRAGALIVLSGPEFFKDRVQLCALALAHHLPSVHQFRDFPEAGGLLSYGPDISDLSVRAAQYVARILEGAKPAEMPVQQPTRFVLAINVRTAKALGLDIPQKLLVRADEVIR